MKKICLLFFISVILLSCGQKQANQETQIPAQPETQTEADQLVQYLAQSGDYVNSRVFPSMIKPETLAENLDSSTFVIDIREPEEFIRGHIRDAVNVKFQDLPTFFESGIKPYEYDKIVLVCDNGQASSYTTMLLRLMGYGNVYALRWGMSAWNTDLKLSESWKENISSKYESRLEAKDNPPPAAGAYPALATGQSTPEGIFKDRILQVFNEGLEGITVTADDVFSDPGKYFLINYERKDKYESGHIPGAVRYKPGATLGIASEMKTIPADKDVVVYCATGHNSAFVTAYLRLLGYKAHSLRYGNNAFMHDKMLSEKVSLSWEAFTAETEHIYPYVK